MMRSAPTRHQSHVDQNKRVRLVLIALSATEARKEIVRHCFNFGLFTAENLATMRFEVPMHELRNPRVS